MNLWSRFLNNTGRGIFKWDHYFPIYEEHLSTLRNRSIFFLEIGVYKGGSISMFSEYFGPLATCVGIDIDEQCKNLETEFVNVRIGNQSDVAFLNEIIMEFGAPDVVLDDGSHVMSDVKTSFDFLYPRMSKNGIYIVEDMHTAYWTEFGGGYLKSDTFVEYSKSLVDSLNAQHSSDIASPGSSIVNTKSITFYDSVVVFQRGTSKIKTNRKTGSF